MIKTSSMNRIAEWQQCPAVLIHDSAGRAGLPTDGCGGAVAGQWRRSTGAQDHGDRLWVGRGGAVMQAALAATPSPAPPAFRSHTQRKPAAKRPHSKMSSTKKTPHDNEDERPAA